MIGELFFIILGGILGAIAYIVIICAIFSTMAIGEYISMSLCAVFCIAISGVIFGTIAIGISEKKGNDEGNAGFWWGFWLGLLGLLIVAFQPNNKSRAETEENIYETEIYDMEIDETLQNNCEVEEIKRYKKMLNDGLITEEEFSEKKKQILGI